MAVKIRLKRTGAKKQPSYRIVVADSRSPRDGRFIEEIGFYNPQSNPKQLKVDEEAARSWLAKGAQPTDTVRDILKKVGVIEDNSKKEYAPKAKEATVEIAPEAVEEAIVEEAKAEEAEVESAPVEAEPEKAKEETESVEVKDEKAEVEAAPVEIETEETEDKKDAKSDTTKDEE